MKKKTIFVQCIVKRKPKDVMLTKQFIKVLFFFFRIVSCSVDFFPRRNQQHCATVFVYVYMHMHIMIQTVILFLQFTLNRAKNLSGCKVLRNSLSPKFI